MAYDVFQSTSKAPNIDVNLFPNAATAGVNAGNALPSTTTSIIQGLTKGVATGLDLQGKYLANEAQAAKNEVTTDPAVIQAEKDRAIAEAQIKQAEARIKQNEDSSELKLKAMDTKLKLKQTEEKLGDIDNQSQIQDALATPGITPEELVGLGKKSLGTFGRDNAFAEQTMAEFKKRGVPDADINGMRTIFNAEERAKQDAERVQKQQERLVSQRDKDEEKIALATKKLTTASPEMQQLMTRKQRGESFNPALLDIVPTNQLQKEPGQRSGYVQSQEGRPLLNDEASDNSSYTAVYDGEIIGAFSNEMGKELVRQLPDYRLSYAPDLKPGDPTTASTTSNAAPQISADQYALDRDVTGFDAAKVPSPASPTSEEMEGKTPEGIARLQAGFKLQEQEAGKLSREYRGVVRRVNSNPILAVQPPIIKAIASVESSGNPNAVSDTGVRGFVGMTKGTFDGLVNLFPQRLSPEMFDTEQGKIAASKLLVGTLYKKYRDLNMTLTAYNAGEAAVDEALTRSKDFNDPRFQVALKNAVVSQFGQAKWDNETKNYARKATRYYSIYK